ncbi:Lysine exporter protein (LYSE/YGGA) [Desulfovibrio sp. X2]|uniref:LysE family translocator n=1 Tax=Desulfovibrio sp. X2 TaxID=941449 RepID=UPI000358B2F1|nr:LysE family transporter [Desulfovibrio sp. X2]EPR37678.1 Lysine exporter protein (LYSE/YGGA) [Desulfovibrio sp. X2]
MNIVAFLAYCIVVTFTPGPTNVVILATAQNHGPRAALRFASGAGLALAVLIASSAVLNDMLLGLMPRIRLVMGVVGAAYMLYLAYRIYTSSPPRQAAADASDDASETPPAAFGNIRGGAFAAGFAMQFVNPKVILFALTVISGFVTPYASSPLHTALYVLLITAIACSALYSWVVLGAVLRRFLFTYRRQANLVMALFLVYCAFAVLNPPGVGA